MYKKAQNYTSGFSNSPFDSFGNDLASSLSKPLGWGLGILAARQLWKGSPMVRGAALVGLPAALYNYYHYSDPLNLVEEQAQMNKQTMEDLQNLEDSRYSDPRMFRYLQQQRLNNLVSFYESPARTALKGALPMFALGAALPSAMKLLKRR